MAATILEISHTLYENIAVPLALAGVKKADTLLFPTGILMVFSIPVGIGLGYLCFPLLSFTRKSWPDMRR